MRPKSLKTKIFLDSGDPKETRTAIELLGFLDGQTTNPTLISKNPEVQEKLKRGEKFSKADALSFYRKVVEEISKLIPRGSISIETYADFSTTADEMLREGREMFSWIPNAHVKYPATKAGLAAAERSVKTGLRVNMTLCFSQEQAVAVYAATHSTPSINSGQAGSGQARGAKKGQVFVSPFVGRLDDVGVNGMSLIANIIKMYEAGDGHVEVLTASVRNLDHFLYAIELGSDIITAPFKILKEWAEKGMPVPGDSYKYDDSKFKPVPYRELDLKKDWRNFNIEHQLTAQGIERFASDWNALIM